MGKMPGSRLILLALGFVSTCAYVQQPKIRAVRPHKRHFPCTCSHGAANEPRRCVEDAPAQNRAPAITALVAASPALAVRPPDFVSKQPGYEVLPSGLQVKDAKIGAGAAAQTGDRLLHEEEDGHENREFELKKAKKALKMELTLPREPRSLQMSVAVDNHLPSCRRALGRSRPNRFDDRRRPLCACLSLVPIRSRCDLQRAARVHLRLRPLTGDAHGRRDAK